MSIEPTADDQPMIRIRGARTHNLQNVNVDLPAGKLIVMTGVSGSGKSSLAFDTLFAEGQRRYLESVSVQTRGLLKQLPRPDVDDITGLAPTVSVDQRVSSVPARSTLSMTTEIHDFLRLLYARGGTAHCTRCRKPVERQSVDQILQQALQYPERTRLMVMSPVVRGRRGAHKDVLERIIRHGFVRARVDGEVVDLSEAKPLTPGKSHTIEAIVDRILIKDGIAPRLRESIELACRESDGTCIVSHEVNGEWYEKLYSTRFSCAVCDLSFPTPEPRSFSFSSPYGACLECSGLGVQGGIETEGAVPTFHLEACVACGGSRLQEFPRAITFLGTTLADFSRQNVEAALMTVETWLDVVRKPQTPHLPNGPDGEGALTQEARLVADRTLPDIRSRLKCLLDMGIGYLQLDRPTRSLSGGEFQRARLAASLSSQLFGTHFVLDEPTAGLHPRDTHRLLKVLRALRDSGGTVIVVEHDGEVMQAADWLIDLGPGAGADGGHLLYSGPPAGAAQLAGSATGDYLRRFYETSHVPHEATHSSATDCENHRKWKQSDFEQPVPSDDQLVIRGARLHNLRNITVGIPLHQLVCMTGVSGSGKSSLVFGTLLPMVTASVQGMPDLAVAAADARCDGIDGLSHVGRILSLDQKPLGRSSRSCIATLCGVWEEVRRLFAKTRDARAKGLSSQHFSFNSGEGRCPECRGSGTRNVRMSFLPDAVVPCPLCHGRRFSRAINDILFRGMSVADILQMRVDAAAAFFSEFERLHSALAAFRDVGLGYMALGQPATTFSGGEAQRAKLAAELASPSREHTLYLLDEPTSGLHPADVDRLMHHLRHLVNTGHSVIVIEHHRDVMRAADWLIDIGPDSADRGGEVVFAGPPEALRDFPYGETARVLFPDPAPRHL